MEKTLPIFHLRLAKDKMSIHLDCRVHEDNLDLLVEEVQKELIGLGVQEPPDLNELKETLKRTAAEGDDPNLKDFVLIQGYPPTPPVDSKIEWAGDFFNTGFVVNPVTGAIDYRRRAAQLSVAEGQMLAQVIPPKEGTPGRNALGKETRAPIPVAVTRQLSDKDPLLWCPLTPPKPIDVQVISADSALAQ